ncbi:MAG TPA: hypothetical protein VK190_04440 [Pseudoneobacillus sp.]|nr:hypothetical protein [Pseudoneobacillus sp.]
MIKLKINTISGLEYDITGMVKTVSWGGDINTLPRKIEVGLFNTADITIGNKLVNIEAGNMATLYKDDEEVFRGYIFKTSTDQSGNDSFTAYDELIYTTKNNVTILVKDKTASEVIAELFQKYGIQIGSIQPTTYKIKKLLFQNQTIADVITKCLEEDTRNTGQHYTWFASKGLVYLWTRKKAQISTVDIDNIISGTNEVSIEDLRTQVFVTKGSLDPDESTDVKFASELVEDKYAAEKYGVMQAVEEAWDSATVAEMKNIGNTVLASLNEPTITSSIEFLGDITCKTGRIINVEDKLTGMTGKYYITSDNHTWDSGVYKMQLQLSKKLK